MRKCVATLRGAFFGASLNGAHFLFLRRIDMLIKCPECGKEISDQAEACIHCGCPISKQHEKPHKDDFSWIEEINGHQVNLVPIIILYKSGNKLQAVKDLTEQTGMSLKEAKDYLDNMCRERHTTQTSPRQTTFHESTPTKRCSKCGAFYPASDAQCPSCGHNKNTSTPKAQPNTQKTSIGSIIIFCIILFVIIALIAKGCDGSNERDTATCSGCGKTYYAGDSGGNYMSIGLSGYCKKCKEAIKWGQDMKDYYEVNP